MAARATVLLDAAGESRARKAIAARYGWQFRLFTVVSKVRRSGRLPHVGLAVRVEPEPRS